MTSPDVGDAMKEIELTQGQVALVDDIDYEYLSQWKWCANWYYNCFRAVRGSPRRDGKRKTISMHTVVAERKGIDITQIDQIDHKDHNTLNNRRSNLRSATAVQNGHNRGANKNSTTGVKGVCFDRTRGKYRATLGVAGKHYFLGRFDTIPEAAAAVRRKREELVGEFTCH